MNQYLQQRIETLFRQYDRTTLATCGSAGVQISVVTYDAKQLTLHLYLPHGSDHLFNLESNPELVLLTPSWKLQGRGKLTDAIPSFNQWQVTILVKPIRLHILNDQASIETIDFEGEKHEK